MALLLGAGLYVSAGINTAAAGEGPPPPLLIHPEAGFDFTTSPGTESFVDVSGPPITGGSAGVMRICPGCGFLSPETPFPNVLSITRSDGSLFAMTGLVGASFGGPIPVGPLPTDFPDGVDFAVFTDPAGEPVSGGVLAPGLFEFHAISTTFVSELFILSPPPIDGLEGGNCLCFDSMDFLVDFENEGDGPIDAEIVGITVTFDVPEPAAFSVLGLGLVGLALMRRRRQTLRS